MTQASSERLRLKDQDWSIEHYHSDQQSIPEEVLRTFSLAFQYVFANQPYGQFLLYPSEGRAISAQEAFGTEQAVSQEHIQDFDPSSYARHPDTGEAAVLWVDPHETQRVFTKKLARSSILSVLRDPEGRFTGAVCGYRGTLRDAFQQEEWENQWLYASPEKGFTPKSLRDEQVFLQQIQQQAGGLFPAAVQADSEVLTQNCLFILPEAQGQGLGYLLLKQFLKQVPAESRALPFIAELSAGSKLYQLGAADPEMRLVHGVFQDEAADEKRVLVVSKAERVLQALSQA